MDVQLKRELDGVPAGTTATALSDADENGVWCGEEEAVFLDIEFADGSTMLVRPEDVESIVAQQTGGAK